MTKRKTEDEPMPEIVQRVECESFRPLRPYQFLEHANAAEPSCFNCTVNVRRYRIVCEPIAEPIEVIHARLQKLWVECDNMHHREPLRREAKKYGLDLDAERYGAKRPKGKSK